VESRSDKLIRSARSTTSRATGRAVRMMKLVRSSRSQAAAVVSKRFSSLVVRSSMRSSRVAAAHGFCHGLFPGRRHFPMILLIRWSSSRLS